jgi:hypothetical protein
MIWSWGLLTITHSSSIKSSMIDTPGLRLFSRDSRLYENENRATMLLCCYLSSCSSGIQVLFISPSDDEQISLAAAPAFVCVAQRPRRHVLIHAFLGSLHSMRIQPRVCTDRVSAAPLPSSHFQRSYIIFFPTSVQARVIQGARRMFNPSSPLQPRNPYYHPSQSPHKDPP